MRPLRSAMYLIDTHHSDLPVEFGEILNEKALRRYEQDLNLSVQNGCQHCLFSVVGLLRVDGSTWYELG